MTPERRFAVAFDATPLAASPDSVTSHTMRGIGRYVAGLMDAVVSEQREWAVEHFRPVITRGVVAPQAVTPIETRRLALRKQDIGPWAALAFDRLAGIRGQATIWHGLDPDAPLSPMPPRRTILTAYDLIPLHEPAAMAQICFHRRAVYNRYLRGLKTARLVLAISRATAEDLQRTLGIPADRIRLIYPAIRPALRASGAPTGAPPHRSSAPPDLLFVGVPDPTKQPELAIAALAEICRRGHDVRLRFCGYHRPADRVRVAAAAAGEVGEYIDYLGRVDDARLTELYGTSVLMAVSRLEGFGLPPVESLLAGGRVVAGDAAAYREVLGDSAHFATTLDGPGLADAYQAAIASERSGPPPELVERYSPRTIAKQLVAAYEEALG